MARKQLDVHLDLGGDGPRLVGQAWFEQRRGRPVTTVFSYSPGYLAVQPIAIDPALPLVAGNQYIEGLPGVLQDSSPDRWGRNLIDKRHRRSVAAEPRRATLNDVDYLVGVSDRTRQGALRFTDAGQATFLHPDANVPKLIDLPRLLRASDQIASGNDDLVAVKELLDAGSGSLGGARPKASVLDTDGRLLLAKFPHGDDEWDVMAWECVALDLAEQAGIRTPDRQLVSIADARNVLLLQRFDRTAAGNRVGYISAMTALAATDGDWHDYVELAERIADISASAKADLVELYRRVVFSVAVHNTDDHLRNHGFLTAPGGWTFAPAFDINPNPDPDAGRSTGISGATHRQEESVGLDELALECRLAPEDSLRITEEVTTAVADWRLVAARRGIAASEIARFAAVLDG